MKKRFLLPALALAALLPGALAAQERPTLEPGTRVRVSTTAPPPGHALRPAEWVVGTVRESNATQLVLKVAGEGEQSAYTIPWDAVQQLEISRGMADQKEAAHRNVGHITIPALLTGTGGGLFYGLLRGEENHDGGSALGPSTVVTTLIGVGVGGLTGVIASAISSKHGAERWEPVRLAPVRTALVAGRQGVGLALQLRF